MFSDILNLIFQDKSHRQITNDGVKIVNNISLNCEKMKQREDIMVKCLEFLRLLAKYVLSYHYIIDMEYVNFDRDNMTVKVRLFDHMDDLLLLDVAIPEMADLFSEVRMLSFMLSHLK